MNPPNDLATELATGEREMGREMKVDVTISGITRTYQGDYDELHNNDWDEIVRDLLDSVNYDEKS